jgi:Mrp family chromosome partitioning ATPase
VNAKESLEKVGAKILGVALNRLKMRGSDYYHYYYYHQYYSHDDEGQGGSARRQRRSRKPQGWRRLLPGTGSGR